jgi:SpoVK/Ycf46/Vps4 family AAA+-type ATPase
VRGRLEEMIHRLRLRQRVLADWSFADKAHDGYGVSALFVGPPGTGKTAGAIALANELKIDLYAVDLSRIMSKWVGETEQNLARVFDEAEASNAALLFDEADALFGKRSAEQKSSSDRYANLTINYLLQRMESYSGLAILTTNLQSAMDAAFQRRITACVHFPPSDAEAREQLWRHLLPADASYADDVDLERLAIDHVMEAAHIRRALARAAFRAASRGQRFPILAAADVRWAASAEYEDMGRLAQQHQHHGGYE